MTDTKYKVGKWYPHAMLKVCPVHPATTVRVVDAAGNPVTLTARTAALIEWENVVAFKVVEEYQEPLVLWVNVYYDDDDLVGFSYRSEKSAAESKGYNCIRTVKMVEVKE